MIIIRHFFIFSSSPEARIICIAHHVMAITARIAVILMPNEMMLATISPGPIGGCGRIGVGASKSPTAANASDERNSSIGMRKYG